MAGRPRRFAATHPAGRTAAPAARLAPCSSGRAERDRQNPARHRADSAAEQVEQYANRRILRCYGSIAFTPVAIRRGPLPYRKSMGQASGRRGWALLQGVCVTVRCRSGPGAAEIAAQQSGRRQRPGGRRYETDSRCRCPASSGRNRWRKIGCIPMDRRADSRIALWQAHRTCRRQHEGEETLSAWAASGATQATGKSTDKQAAITPRTSP